jgi:hypothetical protein
MKIRSSSLFFWVFCNSLPNQVEQTSLKSQLHIVIMSELKFFLLMGVLIQNFNTVDLIKFLEKNQKLQNLIIMVTLKVT